MANSRIKSSKFIRSRRDFPDRFSLSKGGDGVDSLGSDFLDGTPPDLPYSCIDFSVTFFSILTFIGDIGSDIWLACVYYQDGDTEYFACSVAFIVLPSAIMTLFSFWWYLSDYRQEVTHSGLSRVSSWRWVLRAVFLLLQLAPVLRYIDSLIYGVKSQKSQHSKTRYYYYNLMLYEDADSTLLRLVECFMESAPQLVLQLYILSSQKDSTETPRLIFQGVSCSISLLSLAWSLTSYHKALRFTREDKKNLDYCGMLFHFLWQTLVISPRVVAIALFTSHYGYYICPVLGIHWVFMAIWLVKQKTNFCNHSYEEFFFNLICGIIYIFCFFNVKEGATRHKYSVYYTLIFFENLGLIIPWYLYMDHQGAWYHISALVFVFVGHFLGIMFMLIYYRHFHPNHFRSKPITSEQSFTMSNHNHSAAGMHDLAISLPDILTFEENVVASTPTKPSAGYTFGRRQQSSSSSSATSHQQNLFPAVSDSIGTPV